MLYHNPPSTFVKTPSGSIHLDCTGENAFVSHAHSDHLPSFKSTKNVICSKETLELIHAKGKGKKVERASMPGLELLNSGHVLGGKMLFAEGDGATALYTGDFKTSDSLIFKGAEPKECDYLLVESTYGLPQYSFPNRETVYEQMAAWVETERAKGRIVVFGGYSLGKAQEIIAVLNKHSGLTPLVSKSIAAISTVYKNNSVPLDFVEIGSPESEELLKTNFVSVLPMHQLTPQLASNLEKLYGKKVSYASCTGWNLFANGFCLSDHCDYAQLVEFVQACNPKKVFVNHGYSHEFAADLRKRGFNAVPIEQASEKTLMEFV